MVRLKLISAALLFGIASPAAAAAPGRQDGGCLDSNRLDKLPVADGKDAIIFQLSGGEVYRNRLRLVCPTLRHIGDPFHTIVYEHHLGAQLCPGDSLKVVDQSALASTGTRGEPRCVLGDFERLPDERHGRHR